MSDIVFISHSTKDEKVARTICSALEHRGLSCWLARRDVGPGENFQEAIVHAIRRSKVMVLVFSDNANNSAEIKKEIALASRYNITVIPARVEDVMPSEALAYELATRQWINLFENWENEIERLCTWIGKTLAAPSGPLDAASNLSRVVAAPDVIGAGRRSRAEHRMGWSVIAAAGLAVAVLAGGAFALFYKHSDVHPAAVARVSDAPRSQPPAVAAPSAQPNRPPLVAAPKRSFAAKGDENSVEFGGGSFCKYRVSLEEPQIAATADDAGLVDRASLSLTMVETAVPPCPFAPLGTKHHNYVGSGTIDDSGHVSLSFIPSNDNSPKANATFSGSVVGRHLVGTLTVQRVDATGNLAWKVPLKIN